MSILVFSISTLLASCKSAELESVNDENQNKQETQTQKRPSKKSNLGGGVLPISIYPFSDDKDSSL